VALNAVEDVRNLEFPLREMDQVMASGEMLLEA